MQIVDMNRIALLRCDKLPSFVTWDVPNLEELFGEDRATTL